MEKKYECLTDKGARTLTESEIIEISYPITKGILRTKYRHYLNLQDDIGQEVAMHVWKSMPRYDPKKGRLEAFLHGIAENVIHNQIRTAQRREKRITPLTDEMIAVLEAPAVEPGETEDFEQMVAEFKKVLTRIERNALDLKLNGESNVEIYNKLYRPKPYKKTIGQAMSRFWERVKDKYEKWRTNRCK